MTTSRLIARIAAAVGCALGCALGAAGAGAAGAGATGVGGTGTGAADVSTQEITISAAASLQNALRAVADRYEAGHPGAKVNFSFAASGSLLAQLERGAPVDAFASADAATMDRAEARGLVQAPTRVDFAANELVLVSARATPAALRTLADLRGAAVRRIALGTPTSVPAGAYARSALERAGLWALLAPKYVFAANVRQALDYVRRVEVDAAFVYRTDALLDHDAVRIDFAVPGADAVRYPIARVSASRKPRATDAFIAFLTAPQGRAVLTAYGFAAP